MYFCACEGNLFTEGASGMQNLTEFHASLQRCLKLEICHFLIPCLLQVELSLQSFFAKGMKLEVANKTTPDTYWLASIVMPCGQLLRLRYHGYGEDGKADFWCDAFSSDIHPLGWCEEQGKTLEPPEGWLSSHPVKGMHVRVCVCSGAHRSVCLAW